MAPTNAAWALSALALISWCVACGGDDETSGSGGSTSSTTTTAAGGMGGSGGSVGGGGQGGTGGAGGSPVPQNQFLYVASKGTGAILRYTIEDDGSLTANGETMVDDVGPLAVDPSRSQLYAASVSPDSVSVFDIDHSDGSLTLVDGPIDVGIRPVYIAIDPTDAWLFVASYGDDAVQTHALTDSGTFAGQPTSSDSPGTNPHSVLVHPSGQWAFVPVTNSDLMAQYTFDTGTGAITPNGTVNTSNGNPVGPRHLALHPTLDVLYAVNEHADSITTYALDAMGQLSELDTQTTIPNSFDGNNNTCADIHVTPDGSALYASNRGHDSLAMFSLDGSGLPSALGQIDTEQRPREFEVSADGRYVYAAGQDSDQLASYAVEANGSLTALDVISAGDNPSWVLAISVDAP